MAYNPDRISRVLLFVWWRLDVQDRGRLSAREIIKITSGLLFLEEGEMESRLEGDEFRTFHFFDQIQAIYDASSLQQREVIGFLTRRLADEMHRAWMSSEHSEFDTYARTLDEKSDWGRVMTALVEIFGVELPSRDPRYGGCC